ncbi:hypothetical protein [Spirosoma arcticum]
MTLNAGPIRLTYEKGFLRTFLANGEEVLRMIYLAFRNRDWDTARISITDESVRSEADSFTIDYAWEVNDLGMHLIGNAHIEGHPDGSIAFDFYGEAVNTFLRNRVGFCVLHPVEGLHGQPCVIESPDGQTTEAVFPDLISPHQPFLNIQAMTWTMASGQRFRCVFSGAIFETEDQRNWTDASYKTYCTPLERPFPVEVQAGTAIRQRVMFQPIFPPPGSVKTQTLGEGKRKQESLSMRIGLGHRADGPPLTTSEVNLLKPLSLSHLRADVFLSNHDWQNELLAAWHDANKLSIPLELALFFGTGASTEAPVLVDFAQSRNILIHSILLFQADPRRTTDVLLNQVVPIFRAQMPNVLLGGGTDGNFVELNRYRFDFGQVDFVTYSINPQVHAFDDQTLMENVAAQADTIRSARALSGGKPIHVSPVTLLPRYNPDAGSGGVRSIPPADPRLLTEFGVEWTRRSIQTLTQAGAAFVTYYETHGPRGLLNGEKAYPVFDAFKQFR